MGVFFPGFKRKYFMPFLRIVNPHVTCALEKNRLKVVLEVTGFL